VKKLTTGATMTAARAVKIAAIAVMSASVVVTEHPLLIQIAMKLIAE
jgi:hypothetical protein